jgi:tetratricopeptide (TPR) repeat protein
MPTAVPAQSSDLRLAAGIAAMKALDPRSAADSFEAILAGDSLNAEANWRAALALIDIGKRVPDNRKDRVRDSLYLVAERYARRAVALAPDLANAHFVLGLAIGRSALTKGSREKVQAAAAVRNAAGRALELDPRHDGAWHMLGRWNAEVERLSKVEEFIARNVLGGGVMREASYEEAVRCLSRAVELRGDFIYHRLDLALVLVDLKRWAEARSHLEIIPTLPALDVMDHVYRAQASQLLRKIRDKH